MKRGRRCRHAGWTAAASGLAQALLLPAAHAHAVDAPQAAWVLAWSFEPWVVVCLLLSLLAYATGTWRLWAHAGRGRGLRLRQVAAFAGGWLALVVALVSPVDTLGVQLFSAHMLQHELLMVVAAPLLCLARPLVAWTWALPLAGRRAVGRWVRHPVWSTPWQLLSAPLVAWALHAVLLWGWHLPAWFERALRDDDLHTLQHVSFLGSALLFWWAALKPMARGQRGATVVYLFTTMLHTGFLGALITLSDRLWYPAYLATTAQLGVDALEDQQLGGLLMWVPAGLAYVACGLALCAHWLVDANRSERVFSDAQAEPGQRGSSPSSSSSSPSPSST